ncbi:hypothetical protein GA0070612_1241 [Micromonospora chokoriensis]|uniref:Uncharacterized protein n=1 Tax=Micromonospora chokoriensis TaxID=356851 RepID=A0A1C4VB42_9ACTN|nr:hypothetical protein GA0070612_1241 [Micromonospora chokoriensis]
MRAERLSHPEPPPPALRAAAGRSAVRRTPQARPLGTRIACAPSTVIVSRETAHSTASGCSRSVGLLTIDRPSSAPIQSQQRQPENRASQNRRPALSVGRRRRFGSASLAASRSASDDRCPPAGPASGRSTAHSDQVGLRRAVRHKRALDAGPTGDLADAPPATRHPPAASCQPPFTTRHPPPASRHSPPAVRLPPGHQPRTTGPFHVERRGNAERPRTPMGNAAAVGGEESALAPLLLDANDPDDPL